MLSFSHIPCPESGGFCGARGDIPVPQAGHGNTKIGCCGGRISEEFVWSMEGCHLVGGHGY